MKSLNFDKMNGLIPAIVQDSTTNEVLMLGFMNEEAYQKTLQSKKIWFYSRSKKRLWQKGEESGNVLDVVRIQPDCDRDTLLIKAKPAGPTCHTGGVTCFSNSNSMESDALRVLFTTILDRQKTMSKGSYTASLFAEGLNKICAKVKEESDEVIQAAKQETKQRLIEESADLIYHLFVLMAFRGVFLNDVGREFKARRKNLRQ